MASNKKIQVLEKYTDPNLIFLLSEEEIEEG
jgi:hypothetical protein